MYLRTHAHPVMAVQQQGAQIELFLGGPPNRREALLHQQPQNQLGIPSIMLLLARFRGANLGGVSDLAFNLQFFQQVQKPLHQSDSFDAHQHRARKLRIKLPHFVALVHQRTIHHFSTYGVQHRQRLLASVQITS
ncbi:MAG TPA: hypothetical protein VFI95_10750 [Terriglobales bacterium]|nr:hypothetical protein [Terriglobales bacterium]